MKIPGAIPPQSFEILRDLIGGIIKTELEAQKTVQTDPATLRALNKTKVYSEVFSPFNESEMLAVNIFYFNGDYSAKFQGSIAGDYMFYIDLFGTAASTNQEIGDKRNAFELQRIAGMIRFILESSQYKTLDQPQTIVNTSAVQSLKRTEESDGVDSGNIIMYRIVFTVVATEMTIFDTPVPWAESFTDVSLEETTKGFEYILKA